MKAIHGARGTRRNRGAAHLLQRLALPAVGLLVLTAVGPVQAATQVVQTNPGGIVAVGPVNTDYGFPSWYQDNAGTRVELCLDGLDPYCGFLPGDIPNEELPISFPDNFPEEAFYMLASTTLDLPGGGRAVLVLGLEAAFSNQVQDGDQVVFGRQRVTVRGATPNATLTFRHPYGTLTIDTDADGSGKLVEDISPANGNFTTALKSNIGPFLKWDPAEGPAAPEGYLGDPGVDHTVTGSPFGYNQFSVTGGGLDLSTNLFSVQGKIATNTGVDATRAVENGAMVDVFATSDGTQLQVEGQEGLFATTPMEHETGSNRFYARINVTGSMPESVKVSNIGDKPVSNSVVAVSKPHGITITAADYDGATLSVSAVSRLGKTLSVAGFGEMAAGTTPEGVQTASFTTIAPPSIVSVKDADGGSASVDLFITGGEASPEGLPPLDPDPDPGPVVDPAPDPAAPAVARATPATANITHGGAITLDGSTSTGAATYEWTQVSGPEAAISSNTTAKPVVTLPFFTKTSATEPVPAAATSPVTIQLVVTNAAGVASAPSVVELAIVNDVLTIDPGAQHRLGKEFKIAGTAVSPGITGRPVPATSVVIYDTTPGFPVVKLGTATADALNAWSFKAKPGPNRQITSVLVQSTRGAATSTAVAPR